MALSYSRHTADGVQNVFPMTFPYIDVSHIKVTVNGEPWSFKVDNQYKRVELTPIPPVNSKVMIRRVTNRTKSYSTFSGGNAFGQVNLNNSFLWQLYISQEISEGGLSEDFVMAGDLDMGGNRIVNLGRPRDSNDAVRLIDLKGGSAIPRGVAILGGLTYVQLDNKLPVPTAEGAIHHMTLTVNFLESELRRTMFMTEGGDTVSLSGDLLQLILKDSNGITQAFNLNLDIPVGEKIELKVLQKLTAGKMSFSVMYDGYQSDWLSVGAIKGNWIKMFGGVKDAPSRVVVYNQSYSFNGGLVNSWDYFNQTGINVLSTYQEYFGTFIGDEWEAVDEDDGGLDLSMAATKVSFDTYKTGYDPKSTTADKVLREIDSSFIRTDFIIEEPDLPDGTVLSPYRTWLVDTSKAPRHRPLPANPANGVEVRVRDNTGHAFTNNVSVSGNGNTIMGLDEDLVMSVSWAWYTLKYFDELKDWRVVEGGVGAQVRVAPSDEIQMMYPIGHVMLTKNAENPTDYLGFGSWRREAQGLVLIGAGTGVDSTGEKKTVSLGINQGKYKHTIGISQMPSHDHTITNKIRYTNPYNERAEKYHVEEGGENWPDAVNRTSVVGGNEPLDHFYPTFGVYIWVRIA